MHEGSGAFNKNSGPRTMALAVTNQKNFARHMKEHRRSAGTTNV